MHIHKEKPRVLHIILDLKIGGAQKLVAALAENLKKKDLDIVLCVFSDGPLRSRLDTAGIRVEILSPPCCTFSQLPKYTAELWRIRRELVELINKYKINIIQTSIISFLDFLVLSLRFTTSAKHILWSNHSVDFLPHRPGITLKWRRFLSRSLYRFYASSTSGFVAGSPAQIQAIVDQIGVNRDKIYLINNSVNTNELQKPRDKEGLCKQLGISSQSNLVISVGRLSMEKGHRFLVESAPEVISIHPDTHFLLVGDGDQKETLLARASEDKYSKQIHFLGDRMDVPELLASSDIFVLPSLREGLSIALLEAMAVGIPVVATSIAGTSQIIDHGGTGILVPPSDPSAIAKAVIKLIEDQGKARTIGQAAREMVLNCYSSEQQTEKYISLYNQLLE